MKNLRTAWYSRNLLNYCHLTLAEFLVYIFLLLAGEESNPFLLTSEKSLQVFYETVYQ